jgi:lactate dehydrogenase-like 2-hydroxyacid dehydrogenase
MEKEKVFVTRRIPEAGLELLRKEFSVVVWPDALPPSQQALLDNVEGAAAILCLLSDRIDAQVMDAAGAGLKVISNYAVGIDNIDVTEASRRGIPVGNTPGVLTEASADHAFALLMAAARRVAEGDRQVRNGGWKTWEPMGLLGADIHSATLGIIGYGRIGQSMARRAHGFAMRVLFYDPTHPHELDTETGAVKTGLDKLLAQSDFVSLHAPLTETTKWMFNKVTFEQMKSGAILVNTARSGLINQLALIDALENGRLGGAALDVSDPEPLPMDHPLLKMDNLVITPHIASASRSTRERMSVMAAENVLAGLRGERLPNCVNPEVYKKLSTDPLRGRFPVHTEKKFR